MSEREPARTEDPLFRREAIEDYLRDRDHGRLLNVSPLWSTWAFGALLLLFAGAVAFAALTPIGVDATGQALVRRAPGGAGALEVVCVLPADTPGLAHASDRIAVEFGSDAPVRLALRVSAPPSPTLAPADARTALGPDAAAAAVIAGPVVLVRAALPPGATLAPGAAGRAWLRTGSTSLLRALALTGASR